MPGLPMYEEALDQAGEAISLMMAQYSRKQSVNWKHVMQLTDQIMPIHRVGAPDTARLLIVFNKIYDWVANASDHKDSSNIRFTTPQKRQNFGALLATAARLVNAARAGYEDAHGLKDGIGGGGRSRKATDDTDIYLRILKEGGDELLGMANAIHDGADRTALDGMVMRLRTLTLKLGMVIDRLNPAGAKPNYPDARYAKQYLRRTFDKIQKAPLSTGQAQSLSMELENAGDSLHRLVDEMSKGQAGKSQRSRRQNLLG